jgi:hypothetical protein
MHRYTVEKAVADWLADGQLGRTAKTVEVNRARYRRWRAPAPPFRLRRIPEI